METTASISRYAPGLEPLLRPICELRQDPDNARSHDERNLAAIRDSLTRFGLQKPIVVSPDNIVIAGNGTLQAARDLGWTHIACVTTDLAGLDARGFALADNRSAELATWDMEALRKATSELEAVWGDLSAMG
ncbi:MAG: ParB N-terminal domain-containing protein, partial [Planctomycetes bacterium]|nr:ParB N-terminal domain-containing protein [Planctomycetota bacterium]